jgi:(R,R)-butanediol dehydrogenase/meso-butanediol dehydrogenase/diacetyl reductase
MRAIEVAADRSLTAVQRPEGAPGAGQALVEVAYCGICGSDLHFRDVPELFPHGTVPGHEFSGRIVALGEGTGDWNVGDRVCVLPFGQCGECDVCRSGNEQVCPNAISGGVGLGTGRPGAYAEQVIVDQRMLFALPESVDDRAGALVEPLAVAVRAVAQAAVPTDEPVAVFGAGAVGVMTALVARERGYGKLVLVSRNPARGERAAELGLDVLSPTTYEAAAPTDPPACVFECAGTPSAAALAVQLLRPLGKLMLVGVSLEPLELAAPSIVLKELQLRGILAYTRAEFAQAIELLAAGRIPVDALITGTAPLEHAEASFQALSTPGNAHLKVLPAP